MQKHLIQSSHPPVVLSARWRIAHWVVLRVRKYLENSFERLAEGVLADFQYQVAVLCYTMRMGSCCCCCFCREAAIEVAVVALVISPCWLMQSRTDARLLC